MNITIRNRQKARKLGLKALRSRIATLLRTSGLPEATLGVLFVGDRAMRELNRRWRHKDATTDVLSFSLREGEFSQVQPDLLGDIVISVPQAARQARQIGHSLTAEIDRLLVHGLAHLLGYDHERGPAEARRMRARERTLLARIDR